MCFVYKFSTQSLFTPLYHLQMLMMIPMFNIGFSQNIVDFYRATTDAFGNFFFLPRDFLYFGGADRVDGYDYHQYRPYLELIGLESGSVLSNTKNFIFVLILLSIVIAILAPVQIFLKWKKPKDNEFTKGYKWVFHLTAIRIPVRLFFLSYSFLILASLSEFAEPLNATYDPNSYSAAVIIYLICVALPIPVLIVWWKTVNVKDNKTLHYSKEFFVGLKDNYFARTYPIVWMVKRLFMMTFIIGFAKTNHVASLVICIILQLEYLVYYCAASPIKSKTYRTLEFFEEVMVLIAYF